MHRCFYVSSFFLVLRFLSGWLYFGVLISLEKNLGGPANYISGIPPNMRIYVAGESYLQQMFRSLSRVGILYGS